MRTAFLAAALAASVLASGAASAQSLAEIAARTQKEKDVKPKAGKVFTEADLQGRPSATGSVSRPGEGNAVVGTTASTPEAAPAPAGATPAEKPKTPDEERADQVKAWRERLDKAQADVTRLSDDVARMQAALNESTASFYGPGRASAVSRLDDARRQLAAAQQSVADIQEEGRRSGMR